MSPTISGATRLLNNPVKRFFLPLGFFARLWWLA
jgi:hypothetical protein